MNILETSTTTYMKWVEIKIELAEANKRNITKIRTKIWWSKVNNKKMKKTCENERRWVSLKDGESS